MFGPIWQGHSFLAARATTMMGGEPKQHCYTQCSSLAQNACGRHLGFGWSGFLAARNARDCESGGAGDEQDVKTCSQFYTLAGG